ncbi:MAG: GAF domain-containing protein [Leptospirales bacterium]|nr:GAF domain-containing protein [Leptospirales bacterium]
MHYRMPNSIKHIIIADELKDDISLLDTEFPIIYTNNIEKTVEAILHDSMESVLLAILIVPFQMSGKIYEYLNDVDRHRTFFQLIIIGSDDDIDDNSFDHLYYIGDFLPKNVSEKKLKFVIRKSMSAIEEWFHHEQRKIAYSTKLADAQRDQEDLIDIGRSLSGEKDISKLLRLILYLSKKITGADAGSIYLIEEDENGAKRLRFKYSHTFSRVVPLEEFVMDMNKKSVAGYVAVTGEVLNIPDVYKISDQSPYSFNPYFDQQNDYISRSMLVVPMKNHLNQIIGVMQLMNSKEDSSGHKQYKNEAFEIWLKKAEDFDKYVVTFDERYNRLLEAIAGQAAVSIENNRLISQIEMQFEEFVKASVTAIESRDPATSGHSFRVANICKAIAYAINESNSGYFKDFNFSDDDIKELEFAALLHDFGKVYIDLNIFKKSKKLYPKDLDNLKLRFDYLYRCIELTYFMKEIDILRKAMESNTPCEDDINKLRLEKESKLARVIAIKDELIMLNEPSVTSASAEPESILNKIIDEIEGLDCMDTSGHKMDILTENDKVNLSVKVGSLNSKERLEIESHVIETYKFVSKIPWPLEYRRIPEIAKRHHEKLDGTGYPDRIVGKDAMPLQSRIMAIADIYDALTAHDRSYKDSVPIDKVKKILREEADRNKIDSDIVDLFFETKLYEKSYVH